MILSITAIDEHGQTRYFSLIRHSLEVSLAFIDQVKGLGHTLIEVRLLDKNRTSDLPLEMFDGVSVSTELEQLEAEWKAILYSPASLNKLKIDQAQEWIHNLERQMVQLELRLSELNEKRQANSTLKASFLYRHNVMRVEVADRLARLHEIHHRVLKYVKALSAG